MISREALLARLEELRSQREQMISADQTEHERMIGQINACGGAIQLCEMLLAEMDAPPAPDTGTIL